MINQRTADLHRIMADNKLDAQQVATFLERKLWTVYAWRAGTRVIPRDALKLLKHKYEGKR